MSAIDSESSYSESIEANICRDMTSAKLVILMVTDDYASFESSSSSSETDASVLSSTGTTTNSLLNQHSNRLTTCDELEFIIETQKPFYILKLCRIMPISTAKLPITSSYASWTRGQPIPSKLTENLLKKIDPK